MTSVRMYIRSNETIYRISGGLILVGGFIMIYGIVLMLPIVMFSGLSMAASGSALNLYFLEANQLVLDDSEADTE